MMRSTLLMENMSLRLGFLVNPVAGMGGRVGLKGTDGVFEQALEMGAEPVAPSRAIEFLRKLKEYGINAEVQYVTCPGIMGEEELESVGLEAHVLPMVLKRKTTAEDSKYAVKLMESYNVDLILFVGGDGTARDILDALSGSNAIPVLGVPSGVKMYSGIFATNPTDAAYIVTAFVKGEARLMEFEIVDSDEDVIRSDRFDFRLYGILNGPFLPLRIQGSKQVSSETIGEHENQLAVSRFFLEEMDPEATYILGPGTTVKCVTDLLGVGKTLLGVDVYRRGRLFKDVNERRILEIVDSWSEAWIVVSPIGRQGILFGRGNQPISPKIIKFVGKRKVIVLATKAKIKGIQGGVLRVDTGDVKIDRMLRGYVRVATDYREWRMLKLD